MNISPSATYTPTVFYQTAFRRSLIAELAGIEASLHGNDSLSSDAMQWHQGFRKALNTNADVTTIYNSFVELLQKILVDALTQTPLEEDAYLGSDGYCYGAKTLCLFEHSLDPNYRFRSPLNLQDPDQEEFSVLPHPIAPQMVRWLEQHKKRLPPSAEIHGAYAQLVNELGAQKVKRLLPTKRHNRIQRIHLEQKARNQHQAVTNEIQESLQALQHEVKEQIQKDFKEVARQVDEVAENVLQKLETHEKRQQTLYQERERQIRVLEREQSSLQQDVKGLENDISLLSREIEVAEQEQVEVRSEIRRVEVAIKKRKKERQKSLIKTIGIIGATIIGTIVIQQVVPFIKTLPEAGGSTISFQFKI